MKTVRRIGGFVHKTWQIGFTWKEYNSGPVNFERHEVRSASAVAVVVDRSKKNCHVGTFFTKNSDVISKKQTIVKSADYTSH